MTKELQEVKVMTAEEINMEILDNCQCEYDEEFDGDQEHLKASKICNYCSRKFIPLSSLASIRERIEKEEKREYNKGVNKDIIQILRLKSQFNLLDEIEGKRE